MLHPCEDFKSISVGKPVNPCISEPFLRDLLMDPIVHRLMARDGVKMAALLSLIGDAQRRLQ